MIYVYQAVGKMVDFYQIHSIISFFYLPDISQ